MSENNIHGKIFKKLREERGYKLKDVVNGVISTRTLMRFEAGETSITLAVFDKLLDNCDLGYLDYYKYFHENYKNKDDIFIEKLMKYVEESNKSKVISECIKWLKDDNISFTGRIIVEQFLAICDWKHETSDLLLENRQIIIAHLKNIGKFGWNEIIALKFILHKSSLEDFPREFVNRIIEDCINNIVYKNCYDEIFDIQYSEIIASCTLFLLKNKFYSDAEKHCKKAIEIHRKSIGVYAPIYARAMKVMLTKTYLAQNKIEGVKMANAYMKYLDCVIEYEGDDSLKNLRDKRYIEFNELNKTGVEFDF